VNRVRKPITASFTFRMMRPDAEYLEGKSPLSLSIHHMTSEGAGAGYLTLTGRAAVIAEKLLEELERGMPRCRITGLDFCVNA